MRIENPSDPWSLTEMVPKINLVVEFVEPKRYMLPPRKGMFTPKKHYKEWKEGVEPYVKDTVVQARNAGCDTVIMVVPASCMKEMARTVLGRDVENSPCCVATLVADVASADSVSWTWHGFATADSLKNNVALIPSFTGPIDALYHPHEGKDPSDAPANKWAAFPEPEPEVLPANYPDLPPFSMSLDEPLPNIPKKKPVTSKKKKPKSSKSQSKPKRAS